MFVITGNFGQQILVLLLEVKPEEEGILCCINLLEMMAIEDSITESVTDPANTLVTTHLIQKAVGINNQQSLMLNVSSVTSPSTASTRDITTPTKEQLKDGFKVPGRRDVPATGSTPQPSLKALIMTEPVKLLNEELGFQNSLLEYLSDDQDFLVIGCVGSQWSGKSSLLSHLAASNCSHFVKQTFFNIANPGVQMKGAVGTVGLDVYITSDRVIWLDCQPLLSAALAERELTSGFSKEYCKDNLSNSSCVGTLVEVQSLQLLSFLYCICHVLIVVQDSLADPNLIRLLQTAEMLKPNLAADESLLDNMPHLVVVYNRARPADLAPEILQKTLKFHQLAFKKSRLQITSSGIFKDNVNFIALLELSLPAALLALPRKSFNMGPTILSEKSWCVYFCQQVLGSIHHSVKGNKNKLREGNCGD
nr:EOG090X0EPT [Eurycercus lamellatus]